MNTDTGRIYGPPELEERYAKLAAREAHDEHQAEFAAAVEDGKIVPVSAHVAQAMKVGSRELNRRRRRNKAARDARKRSR